MNPRVREWQGQFNKITGKHRLYSEPTGFVLDAVTGEPAQMTGDEARRAADFNAQMDPAKNKVVERVS